MRADPFHGLNLIAIGLTNQGQQTRIWSQLLTTGLYQVASHFLSTCGNAKTALDLTEIESLGRILDEFRLSMAEYVMLHLIRFENRSADDAPRFALGLFQRTRLQQCLPTEEECMNAIGELCRRGLTEIVDGSTLRRIKVYLSSYNGIGPTAGLPSVGELDFTLEGADTWRAILNFRNTERGLDCYWYDTGAFIYRRNATTLIGYDLHQLLHDAKCCEFIPVEPYERIGVWRSQWWREIPSGYSRRCRPSN